MTDDDRPQPREEITSQYEVVSTNENAISDEDLYSFRSFHQDATTQSAVSLRKEDIQPKTSAQPAAADSNKQAGKKPLHLAMIAAVIIPVLFVAIILVISLQRSQPKYIDLGSNIFASAGLQGHLITQWEGKAEYRLRIEPVDQQHLLGFAAAVSNPPKPITVTIRVTDASGVVLCNKDVPLKIDPNHVSVYSGTDTLASIARKDAAGSTGSKAGDLAQQDAKDFEKKRGKDVFQSEINSDGNVAAVSTQGDLPCTSAAYKRISSWDLATNFPFADKQSGSEDNKKKEEKTPPARTGDKNSVATLRSLPAPIEGDTAVTGDNLRRGIVETGSGKVFVLDRGALKNPDIQWLVSPAVIHYRCDKKASCMISRSGTAKAQQARLKK
jgi:hypothetical protein